MSAHTDPHIWRAKELKAGSPSGQGGYFEWNFSAEWKISVSMQYFLSPQNTNQTFYIYVGLILKEMVCYAERNRSAWAYHLVIFAVDRKTSWLTICKVMLSGTSVCLVLRILLQDKHLWNFLLSVMQKTLLVFGLFWRVASSRCLCTRIRPNQNQSGISQVRWSLQ